MADHFPLPAGFTPALDVLEERVAPGRIINVIGVVKDCRLPMATRNDDYKCTLTLLDLSTQEATGNLILNIFRPREQMPVVDAGDVVLMLQVKVQKFRDDPLSLITHKHKSVLQVYESTKIPRHPSSARPALRGSSGACQMPIVAKAEDYISWMYQTIDKASVPDIESFNLAAVQSLNVKDKFSLLRDVRQDKFYDIIVQVAREPYDLGDKTTIWVTDFTENSTFYHRSWDVTGDLSVGNHPDVTVSGDSLGYTRKFQSPGGVTNAGQFGPYGKRCMQVTCYEPHATRIRDRVKPGSWILLRNIQVKYGSNGSNLEGFLREDRGSSSARIQVELLNPMDESENIDPRLKHSLKRKRDYEKVMKSQARELKNSCGNRKRQAHQSEGKPTNAKKRRQEKRSKTFEKKAALEAASISLNEYVKCENLDQPLTSIAKMLERPVYRTTTMDHQAHEIRLPFNCAKFRANVRVIDFFPRKLADFACARKVSEYDCLSDIDTGSSTVSDGRDNTDGEVIWDWRFSLRLQDVSKPPSHNNVDDVWVVVDNADAQLLLGLDACNLITDTATLDKLRERLFLLWGNLEEVESCKRKQREEARHCKKADQPPTHSSDAEDVATHRKANPIQQNNSNGPVNLPFSCCIRQYGVKVKERDPLKADAGNGKRWDRVFSLFGTQIRNT